MFTRAALSLRNTVVRRPLTRSMGDVVAHKPSMAELPTPSGSWRESYSKRQRSYNLQLLAGLLFTGATISWAYKSNKLQFGWGPQLGK
ncbi:cytochrome c oxidase subunit 7B isoform X2 [Oratosquilla oratoria]|uniref:cytochrome c oxidase subunit 7B isoform X2 n=1 Tax=Oratosquilla oratoria TaxID=337810 RepID=UPI003F76B161